MFRFQSVVYVDTSILAHAHATFGITHDSLRIHIAKELPIQSGTFSFSLTLFCLIFSCFKISKTTFRYVNQICP